MEPGAKSWEEMAQDKELLKRQRQQEDITGRERAQKALQPENRNTTRGVITEFIRIRTWTFGHDNSLMSQLFGEGSPQELCCPANKMLVEYLNNRRAEFDTMQQYVKDHEDWIVREYLASNRPTRVHDDLQTIFRKNGKMDINWNTIAQGVYYLMKIVEVLNRTFRGKMGRIGEFIDIFCDFFEKNGVDKWISDQGGWDVHICEVRWGIADTNDGPLEFKQYTCSHPIEKIEEYREYNSKQVLQPFLVKQRTQFMDMGTICLQLL